MRETKIGKFNFVEIRNPDGSGYTIYENTGGLGHTQVLNMADFPPEIVNKLLGWYQEERPVPDPKKPPDPQPEFNRRGWVL